MSTIYYNTKHVNLTIPTAISLSIGTSGYIYGTSPVNMGGNDTLTNNGFIGGGSQSGYSYSTSTVYASGNGLKVVNNGSILGMPCGTIIYNFITGAAILAAISLKTGTVINNGYIETGSHYDVLTHAQFYTDRYGILATGFATINSHGRIRAGRVGVELKSGGTVDNYGSIFGANAGVQLTGNAYPFNPAQLVNEGTIYSHVVGVKLDNGNAVYNGGTVVGTISGVIKGAAIGVEFTHGGYLDNLAGGLIYSYGGPNDGVYAVGGFVTKINNAGTIASLVNVGAGATVVNSGVISGPSSAIHLNTGTTGAGATITNSGRIGQINPGSGAIWFNGNGVLNNSRIVDSPAYGVSVAQGAVTIVNTDLIEATGPAITITGGQVNIVNGGPGSFPDISGQVGVIAGAAAVVTITNYGSIAGTGAYAVKLLNKSDRFIAHPSSNAVGTVKAAGGVLEFAAGPATYMHNTLGGSYTGFGAYLIDAGGSWSMHGTNTIKSGLTLTNYGQFNIYGALNNSGDIFHFGVSVKAFGVLGNSGEISTNGEAAYLGLFGTLSNTGTVRGVGLSNSQGAVEVAHTSTITNGAGGVIEGYNAIRGVSVTLANSGLVHGYNSCGVYLTSGATQITVPNILNNVGGTIEGGNYGVFATGPATVTNHGSISGAVAGIAGPVVVANSGTISGGQWGVSGHASVNNHGYILDGVGGGGGAAFVYNAGYIRGGNLIANQYAVELAPGGSFTQVAGGTLTGAPGRSIGSSGGAAIRVVGGTLAAAIDLAGGVIHGGAGIIGVSYAYTSNPPGAGGAGGAGVDFVDSGSLTIVSGVTLAGGAGGQGGTGKATGGAGGAGGDGLNFDAGGTVSNSGAMVGGSGGSGGANKSGPAGAGGAGGSGLLLGGGGVVDNLGLLAGASAGPGGTAGLGGAGVSATAGGTVFNHGQITGYDGVRQAGAGALTVFNYGVINGIRDAALFGSASDRLVVESGSSFVGEAVGGGGALELAPGGIVVDTITGLGAFGTLSGESNLTFTGFGVYQVDYGETLIETGTIGSGQTLINLGSVTTPSPNSITLAGDGVILNHGQIIDNPATNYRGGVEADSGGRIVNYAGGLIDAEEGISGAGFTLVNSGLVIGYGNCSVLINGPTGSVTNTAGGVLQGYNYGVVSVQAATVVTAGSIHGQIASVEFRDPSSLLVAQAGAVFTGGAIRGGGGTLVASGGSDTLTGLGGTLASLIGAVSGVLGGFNSYAESGGTLTLPGAETLSAGKTFSNSGVLLVTGTLIDLGVMRGGTGATGVTYYGPAGPGGAGSNAATVSGGTLTNKGAAAGGTGGAGGLGYTFSKGFVLYGFSGGAGGAGGAGVTVNSGRLTNTASILGGAGGAGGRGGYSAIEPLGEGLVHGGAGGSGGAAVAITGGTATNSGTLQGGGGGVGGYSVVPTYGGAGGAGGAGLLISGGGFTNTGTILGGAGGAGSQLGAAGVAGDGVLDGGGGQIVNGPGAVISGLNGVEDAGKGGLTIINQGQIAGTHDAVLFGAASDRLVVDAGAAFTGGAVGGGGTVEFNEGGGAFTLVGGSGAMAGAVALNVSGFSLYQLDGGLWTLNAPATLTAGETLRLANAATALAQGVVANAGSIAIFGGTTNTDLRVGAAGLILSGGGALVMSGAKSRILGAAAGATLTNVDNTITGFGFVAANSLTLVNQSKGVIDAVGAFGLTVGSKGETVINQGLMEATGGGSLVIANSTVINTGTLLATNLSPVKLQNAVVRGGSIIATGSGVVKFNVAGGALDGTTNAVSLSGVMALVKGSNETLEGSIVNAGKINLTAGTITADLIVGAGGATLSGGGQVNMTNSLGNRIYGLASGDTLTNVDNRIDGAGVLGNGTMTLVNDAAGQIVGNQNLALTIDTGTNTITNAGLIENVGKGGTLVKSAVNNTGTLLAATAGTLTLAGAVTGTGIGQIAGGTLYVQQAFAENVTFSASTGVLELGDSQAFTGTVTGLSKTGTNWLDLVDIGFFAAKTKATYSGTTASGTLTVTDGTHTAHVALQGNYTGATWTVSGDGHGGTKVVDPSASAAALAQGMSGFHASPALGLDDWTPRPPPRLIFAHVQT